ncbi:MAG: 2OG-Fe(II) oxygenase family protein [Gammaproteobacteria bacterium]|nr:2OG-Fe(II) oxygenase family protein [Gammaproteobacteria bacterium]
MEKKDDSWIESSDVLSVFPTFVWNVQLRRENYKATNAKVIKALKEMRVSLPPLGTGEAWQSSKDLHKLGEFGDLVSRVHGTIKIVLRFLKIGYDAIEITGCWANISAKGASHRMHAHPNNFLSGVYYVQTHPEADTINFHDPRIQAAIIRPPVTELTAQNTDQVVVKVRNGTLLVFPSYLQHSVDSNRSDEERISISFNVMFSSFTENISKPLW